MAKLLKHRLKIGLIMAGTVVVSVVAFFILKSLMPTSPAQKSSDTTYRLYKTTEKLEKSFSSKASPGVQTSEYLGLMSSIQKNCEETGTLLERAKEEETEKNIVAAMNETDKLCEELSKVAKHSADQYSAIKPVMNLNSDLKRYHTLPLVRDNIRNGHLKKVEKTQEALEQQSSDIKDFPSAAGNLLVELSRSIEGSSKLQYYPAIGSFQTQMLAEREHYWKSYVNLAPLQNELRIQLSRYCNLLELDEDDAVCKSGKSD